MSLSLLAPWCCDAQRTGHVEHSHADLMAIEAAVSRETRKVERSDVEALRRKRLAPVLSHVPTNDLYHRRRSSKEGRPHVSLEEHRLQSALSEEVASLPKEARLEKLWRPEDLTTTVSTMASVNDGSPGLSVSSQSTPRSDESDVARPRASRVGTAKRLLGRFFG